MTELKDEIKDIDEYIDKVIKNFQHSLEEDPHFNAQKLISLQAIACAQITISGELMKISLILEKICRK